MTECQAGISGSSDPCTDTAGAGFYGEIYHKENCGYADELQEENVVIHPLYGADCGCGTVYNGL